MKYEIELIVVGGLSVEIYTDGGYTTQDIDFVGVGHEKVTTALKDLGFISHGKDSIHEELKIYVEIPDSVSKDSNSKYIKTMDTQDGFALSIIGIEDIIKDRIRALLYFKEYHQGKWIYLLIKIHLNDLDLAI
ncbi:hypothetical protein ACFP65_09610 [Marinilactibacillus sp. GCM10026970]|uniref:hypothetical protein n=1 Tax=Marinilactibacillus sp. GCM10026970 TaxID=3252642 RepID=UPI003608C049